MKFDSKHLIRWGIPGWIFILYLFAALISVNPQKSLWVSFADFSTVLGLLVTLTAIGVPIGYILHQIYFFYNWVEKKNKKLERIIDKLQGYQRMYPSEDSNEYLYLEYLWQSELSILDKDSRDYIADRYRHLLSTTHSLGVLTTSFIFSFFPVLYFLNSGVDLWIKILVSIIQLILIGISSFNYNYYSNKTMYMQGMFLNEFVNKPERNKDRKNF
jgi:hypothetical protein